MRIQCDTLKSVTMLKEKGINPSDADGIMSTLSEIDIFNLHSTQEVDSMLSQSVEKVFAKHDRLMAEQRRERDLKFAEQRKEFKARMKDIALHHDAQLREQREQRREERNESNRAFQEHRNELIASRRWIIGTIITVGLSMIAYLSALIHFNHM